MPKAKLGAALSARRNVSAALPSDGFDEVLGLSQKPNSSMRIVVLPLGELHFNNEQRFRLLPEAELAELAYDIRLCGLEHPITVRKIEEGYEVLAGRNRVRAFQRNGEHEIPAIVREADDAMAALIRTGNNLRQRQKIYPSEKAFAYKEQIDAIRHQGKALPPEIAAALGPLDHKLTSRQIIAQINHVDENDVKRHLRLVCLTDTLLERIDAGELAVRAGVSLSYYDAETQALIENVFFEQKRWQMNMKAAERLYKQLPPPSFTEEQLTALLEKPPSVPKHVTLKISQSDLETCFMEPPDAKLLAKLFLEFLESRRVSAE